MAKQIEKVYGDALFQLAVEEGRVDEFYEASLEIVKILKANPEMEKVLAHPKIVKEEKVRLVKDAFAGNVPNEITGLFVLLVEKNHMDRLDEVMDYYIRQFKEYKRIGIAHVRTAVPLTEEQKAAVEKRLLETTDYLSFEMHYKTDPSLIGGAVIRIKDRVIDSSIKSKLYALRREMSQIQVSNL
ncbi:MAG: ATP synthase F1 subunit delta [Lachnospiraceae bacterium]|nr:ATP synthase F1 subunit delta [Lachnospiraceae bacterium]